MIVNFGQKKEDIDSRSLELIVIKLGFKEKKIKNMNKSKNKLIKTHWMIGWMSKATIQGCTIEAMKMVKFDFIDKFLYHAIHDDEWQF